MDADDYYQDDCQDELPQMMNEVKHYSADCIEELHTVECRIAYFTAPTQADGSYTVYNK